MRKEKTLTRHSLEYDYIKAGDGREAELRKKEKKAKSTEPQQQQLRITKRNEEKQKTQYKLNSEPNTGFGWKDNLYSCYEEEDRERESERASELNAEYRFHARIAFFNSSISFYFSSLFIIIVLKSAWPNTENTLSHTQHMNLYDSTRSAHV